VRDPVLAAQEDGLRVDVLHALPGVERCVEHRRVVVGGDAGVVEEHVEPPVLLACARVHVADRLVVRHVGGEREVHAFDVAVQVDAHDRRPLVAEARGRHRPDAAGGARDHAHLAVEPAHVA
jgi:hypothetical protein